MPATLVILLAVAVTKLKCIYCCKVLLHDSYTGRFDFPLAVLLQFYLSLQFYFNQIIYFIILGPYPSGYGS